MDLDLDDLDVAAGQLLVGGFDGLSLPDDVASALEAGHLGGVVLFRRNIRDLDQLVAMTSEVHRRAAPLAPLVCVDQEGGPVRRVTAAQGASDLPAMREVGRANDPRLAARLGEVISVELASLGFNVNFAPVLDVDTNPDNPIIASRAFGRDPERVARLAGSLMAGHFIGGVVPCGKHFPGHGDTQTDSHLTLPIVAHDRERLDAVELLPFRRLIDAGLPMVMTAHLLVPALDAARPATLSQRILGDLLRGELGFEGVIVSDDLEMAGVAASFSIGEIVELGLRAGVDLFLICRDGDRWRAAHQRLVKMATDDPEDRARVFASARRVVELKRRFLPQRWAPSPDWRAYVGAAEHAAVIDAIRDAAEASGDSA